MKGEIVLDLETAQPIGLPDYSDLNVSVAVAYFYDTDTYKSYFESELPMLFKELEGASRIIGFNSKGFDIPLLNRFYPGDLLNIPQLDMLESVRASLGFRLKLDTLASATIGVGKSAHGLQAVQWWKEGRVQEVVDYCKQDVKVTKEVYEFGLQNGFLLFDDRTGARQQVNVDFQSQIGHSLSNINLTLGF